MTLLRHCTVTALLMLSGISSAHADLQWFIAEIKAAGISPSGIVAMRLSDTASPAAFTNQWFVARQNIKMTLATALSATTANLEVWVYTDPDSIGTPEVVGIYARQ